VSVVMFVNGRRVLRRCVRNSVRDRVLVGACYAVRVRRFVRGMR
jgi:hypothetical protein